MAGERSPAPVALLYLNWRDLVKFTGTLKNATCGQADPSSWPSLIFCLISMLRLMMH